MDGCPNLQSAGSAGSAVYVCGIPASCRKCSICVVYVYIITYIIINYCSAASSF
jgi:hypothetical protein